MDILHISSHFAEPICKMDVKELRLETISISTYTFCARAVLRHTPTGLQLLLRINTQLEWTEVITRHSSLNHDGLLLAKLSINLGL